MDEILCMKLRDGLPEVESLTVDDDLVVCADCHPRMKLVARGAEGAGFRAGAFLLMNIS